MTSYAADRRKKEFGIRKILGGSAAGILFLLSKQHRKLIIVAHFFSWPLAYLLMNRWLISFAYRTSKDIFCFLLSGLLVIAVACLTVIYHSLKAASTNPAELLRYE